FYIEQKEDTHLDHFLVLEEGSIAKLAPADTAVEEGAELELKLVEVGRHDVGAAVGKVDGLDVCVGNASGLIGKKVKVRIERVLQGTAYATIVGRKTAAATPITAESEAEKPTRKPPARKADAAVEEPAETAEAEADAAEADVDEAEAEEDEEATAEDGAKKKTRRGSRGGRRRKKPATAAGVGATDGEPPAETADAAVAEATQPETQAAEG